MSKKLSIASVALLVLCLCYAFSSSRSTSKAQDLKTVNIKAEDYPLAYQNKEPVKIVGLYLGTTLLKSGEDFQADKDWLRDLRIMVKNVSDQPIRQVILWLDLPMNDLPFTDPKFQIKRIEIPYGRGYWTMRTPDAKVPEVLLAPGKMAMFGYDTNNPNAYSHLTKHLGKDHEHSLPRKGSISLGAVVFEDVDKGWSLTKYVQRIGVDWHVDPSKTHLNPALPPKRSGSNKSRAAMLKASFAAGKPSPQCWTNPPSGQQATQEFCSLGLGVPPPVADCVGCKYTKPILNEVESGWYRVRGSFQCYHTALGVINTADPCACCQENVWTLHFQVC